MGWTPEEPLKVVVQPMIKDQPVAPAGAPSVDHQFKRRLSRAAVVPAAWWTRLGTIPAAEWIILASLLLCTLEGAARKWLIPEGSPLRHVAYFSKDIIFMLVLACGARTRNPTLEQRSVWLVCSLGLVIFGAALSSMQGISPIGAALTLRATFVLPLVAWWASRRLGAASLLRVALFVGMLTVGNAILGVVQSRLPPDHRLNAYSQAEAAIVSFGESVRACGTFSYISGMGVIALLGVACGLMVMSYGPRHKILYALGLSILGTGMVCALTSISRSPVALGLAMAALWLAYTGYTGGSFGRWLTIVGLLIAGLVAYAASPTIQSYATTLLARHEQATDSETIKNRVVDPFLRVVDAAELSTSGSGLGTEQVAAVFSATGTLSFRNFEDPWPRLVLELGILGAAGFALVAVVFLSVLWSEMKTACCLQRQAAVFAVAIFAACIFATNPSHNHVASGFLWPLIAVALGTRRCEGCNQTASPTVQKRPHRG